MTAVFHVGDVFDVMATLPDNSIDLILTSPPFLAFRSYLPADHPDKGKEIGSEPDPATFIDTMLALTAEVGPAVGTARVYRGGVRRHLQRVMAVAVESTTRTGSV